MLNGLDLCSGIGLLADAISPWVRSIAYCEIELYPRRVLIDRMLFGELAMAPIWDNIETLSSDLLPAPVDIISAGFPCQDISCAGSGIGLGGKRSGLFFEVERLVSEFQPSLVFLENVPAIRTKGAAVVAARLAGLGYDCRWGVLSAFDVGAPHLRERWWLLAHRHRHRCERAGLSAKGHKHLAEPCGICAGQMADAESFGCGEGRPELSSRQRESELASCGLLGYPHFAGLEVGEDLGRHEPAQQSAAIGASAMDDSMRGRFRLQAQEICSGRDRPEHAGWWATEPQLGRVAHGVPYRVERIKALGNGVVRQCAREAFQRLSGLSLPSLGKANDGT